MPIVALSLPLVCAPAPAPAGRSAQPPWGRDSPHWRRGEQQLPQDHRARRVDRAADLLDLSVLFAAYAGTGSLAHRPDLPLKAVLYEAPRGRLSPAQWHQDLLTDEACQWLARGLRPSRPRLYALRDRLGPVLDRRHDALIGAAVGEGLSDASQAALGGSAVAANASRHRLRNEPTLAKRQQALEEAVGADQAGAPPAGAPAWRAATPRGRRGQRRRYRRAHEQLTARRQQNRRRPASKRRADKDVRSGPADPEAAVGLDELKVFRPLYTVQLMPDLNTPLVLAYDVFAQAGDAATLPAMLGRCRRAAGRYPADLLSDSAYAKALGLACCPAAGVRRYAPRAGGDQGAARPGRETPKQIPKGAFVGQEQQQAYVCPEGHPLTSWGAEYEKRKGGARLRMLAYRCDPGHCTGCPRQERWRRCPERGRMVKRSEYEPLVEALAQRMRAPEARALYKRRCQTVELGFADQKEHRGLGRFRGRGLARARVEVGLLVLAHNALAALALRDGGHNPQAPGNLQLCSG